MASRSRTHSTCLRADEVEYFLFINGLSPQCRWQELKDIIRKIPPDGHIRQAHTDNDNGTGWGHITILNPRKAFDTYDYLYTKGWRGHSIRLTLAVKDEVDPSTLRGLRGPEDSLVCPSQHYHPTGHSYSSSAAKLLSSSVAPVSIRSNYGCGNPAPYTNLGTSPIAPIYQSAVPIAMQPLVTGQQPALGYNSYPSSTNSGCQRLIPQSSQPSHSTPQYRHRISPNRSMSKSSLSTSPKQGGLSSNTTGNQGRTVYLFNLPYTVSQQAIKEHLDSVGVIDRCLVKEDRQRSSKYKLTAVVTFRTPEQAQAAIDQFNKSTWKGYEIKVKLDRGPTASGGPSVAKGKSPVASRARENRRETREGPLVVDGSGPSISRRQTRMDSDDESSCDESS